MADDCRRIEAKEMTICGFLGISFNRYRIDDTQPETDIYFGESIGGPPWLLGWDFTRGHCVLHTLHLIK